MQIIRVHLVLVLINKDFVQSINTIFKCIDSAIPKLIYSCCKNVVVWNSGILTLSRELSNTALTNVAFGVSLTYSHWRKTPQYPQPVFPLRLGKCEIAQTGLDKSEFLKNCLSLPKTASNLPKCPQ